MVLAIPLGLRMGSGPTEAASLILPVQAVQAMASAEVVHDAQAEAVAARRAATVSRGASIAAGNTPETSIAPDVKPVVEYTLGPADTLPSLANFYAVSAEAIAFANGITDPSLANQVGRTIRIPPGEGALYTVQDGDTVESVAQRFGVRAAEIMDYNRLYFEPEHFAPGKLLFVPGARLPGLVYVVADPRIQRPVASRIAAPQGAAAAAETLDWPVPPDVSQPFWAGHSGMDIAAPYGSTIAAAAAGTVSAAGWVAVGGLRVCVRTGALEHCYYHTAAVFVGEGQRVERGQAVAAIGLTGVTTGPHVHFEVKRSGTAIDPQPLLR
jgi:murein DD-endopeptidase MepM/ murein hydrolase activator NlpD